MPLIAFHRNGWLIGRKMAFRLVHIFNRISHHYCTWRRLMLIMLLNCSITIMRTIAARFNNNIWFIVYTEHTVIVHVLLTIYEAERQPPTHVIGLLWQEHTGRGDSTLGQAVGGIVPSQTSTLLPSPNILVAAANCLLVICSLNVW